MQRRHQRDQVGIATTLAIPVDRALYLGRPRPHRLDGIRHGCAAVVVRVNSHRHAHRVNHHARDGVDLVRQVAAVRIAQHHAIDPGPDGGLKASHRERRIVFKAVEEVLGIQEDLAVMIFQIAHRIGDHGVVLFERRAQHVPDMQLPRLPEDGADRRTGLD